MNYWKDLFRSVAVNSDEPDYIIYIKADRNEHRRKGMVNDG